MVQLINRNIMFKYGLFFLIGIVSSCGGHPDSHLHEDEAQPHQAITYSSTLFTDSTEFFIEYEALIKQEESHFLIYVTRLQSYKPYHSGKLSIQISGHKVEADRPERPGIFELHFTPESEGIFQITYELKTDDLLESVKDSILVIGDHEDADELEDEDDLPGEIHFLKEQAWNSSFMVRRIDPVSFSSVVTTSGELLAMPGEKHNIIAKSPGIVLFENKNLVQGSNVEHGQNLFTISGQDLLEKNVGVHYQEAMNNFLKSKSEYMRHMKLYTGNIISEKQFVETQTRYLNDSTHYYSLSANASAIGLKVYASLKGSLHELNVSEGQYVDIGQILATISTNQVLLLRADVPQQFYPQIKEIETAHFRPAYASKTYTVQELNGRLLAKGSSVAENNHYIPVYFEVLNDGTLLEGAFVECYLKTSNRPDQLVVPYSAILEEQGSYYLYVQENGEIYHKRAITTGGSDGLQFAVTSGLLTGERIVTEGTMLVKAASMAKAVAAQKHQH